MIKCLLCGEDYKQVQGTFRIKRKSGFCASCVKELIEGLFSQKLFNEWLDSFLQSRIEKYIPEYNEYFELYNKQKCPDCNGTGIIDRKPCQKCGFVGVIEAET